MTEHADDQEHEGPTLADLEELAHEFNDDPPARTNTIAPRTLDDVVRAAHTQGLEPYTSANGRWVGFDCPVCKNLGAEAAATIELEAGGLLKASCGGCHDNVDPGVLAALGTIPVNGNGKVELGGTSTVRAPTVLSWADYRSQTPPEIQWLVRGLIPAHGFCVIGSTPKAGKTWFLSLLAICCATGKPFLGQFVVVDPIKVHFLALEGSAAALRHRIGCLARGLGIDPDGDLLGENLHIDYKPRGANLSEAPYAAWYCQEVERLDAKLCLIDTVRRAARIRESGAGVEDLQTLGENLEPLKNTRSVLFAHHARKMQPANQNGTWTPPLERLSGSGDWGGLVEMGLVLDRRKGTEWRDTRMEIDGRDIPGFLPKRIIYEGDGTGPEGLLTYDDELAVRIEDLDETDEDETQLSSEQVSAWLSEQPRAEARTSAIAEHFGVTRKTVQRAQPGLRKWGVAWSEPQKGKSQTYWLSSPAYAHLRAPETTET